jgi:hypothetical protein
MCDLDDDFMDEPLDDDPLQDDTPDETLSDGHCGPVLDWMLIGPLSEDLARERRERERIRREMFGDDEI